MLKFYVKFHFSETCRQGVKREWIRLCVKLARIGLESFMISYVSAAVSSVTVQVCFSKLSAMIS